MAGISTHVLDTALGRPAAGIPVTLECEGVVVSRGTTDADGRVKSLLAGPLRLGPYRLTFELLGYAPAGFYPRVVVDFEVREGTQNHHVPLLLSPFGYSTYRGS